jgi:hypothetical protein
MARINQVLNYPALAYGDIYHFFDQAIAELNTNLRIALPSVSEMRSEHTLEVLYQPGIVRLNALTIDVHWCSTKEELPTDGSISGAYVCKDDFTKRAFYKWDGSAWNEVDVLYGTYIDGESVQTFVAIALSKSSAVWTPVAPTHTSEFDLTDYLPLDWWTLFVIPYVCFKFAVRNGDSGELFVDEYTQGYQQLQSSYNVPNTIKLTTVAGMPAYKKLVEQNLANLNITVFTRAIYENMRVGNGIASVYGGFYETGGWGV